MPFSFSKYQGLGNDFVVVDLRSEKSAQALTIPLDGSYDHAKRLCDRRLGIGGDGVLTIAEPTSQNAAATMRVLNADGTEAEMCGNGLRCVAKHLLARTNEQEIIIDTGAGPLLCTLQGEDVRVEMGPAGLVQDRTWVNHPLKVTTSELTVTTVSMGNPHVVHFTDESDQNALLSMAKRVGPQLEVHQSFPEGINVEFAHLRRPTEMSLVVWERGCGITQACGTGACAAAVAACQTNRSPRCTPIQVELLGGTLQISVAEGDSNVTMTGPATLVFSGIVSL